MEKFNAKTMSKLANDRKKEMNNELEDLIEKDTVITVNKLTDKIREAAMNGLNITHVYLKDIMTIPPTRVSGMYMYFDKQQQFLDNVRENIVKHFEALCFDVTIVNDGYKKFIISWEETLVE